MKRSQDYTTEAAQLRAELTRMLFTARVTLDATQRDVADALGVHQVSVGRWEKGEVPIPDHRIGELAKFLRVRMDDLRTLCERLRLVEHLVQTYREIEQGEAALQLMPSRHRGKH